MSIRGLRSGLRLGQGQLEDTLWSALLDTHCGCTMGRRPPRTALRSTAFRAKSRPLRDSKPATRGAAWRPGGFTDESAAVESVRERWVELFAEDDHRRPDSTLEGSRSSRLHSARTAAAPPATRRNRRRAAALPAGFRPGVKAHGVEPLARLTQWATVGVEPALIGMGASTGDADGARPGGTDPADIDLIEVNEPSLHNTCRSRKSSASIAIEVNVNGGAIALGHPSV